MDLTAFLNAYPPLSEPMLCAIVGGVISGIGFGLIFRSNCNTGGVDVIAALIKKNYIHIMRNDGICFRLFDYFI